MNDWMDFYVMRRGQKLVIAQIDELTAAKKYQEGWELWRRPLDTRAEAERAKQEWLEILRKNKPGTTFE